MGRGFFNGSSGAGDGVSDRSPESIIDPATGLFAVESDSVDVVISADDDWAESVVSAAIRPLDESFDDSLDSLHTGAIEAVENPDSTQELPELALETFDPAHPVSIPVDAGTTAHFRPLTNPEVEAVDDSDGDSDGDSDDDSAGRSASSRSLRAARRKTSLSRESGYNAADTSGFIPTQEDLSPDRSEVKEIVRGELAGLTAPGGKLAVAIERTVANAVAEALRSVLPALAHEAARIASEEDDSA